MIFTFDNVTVMFLMNFVLMSAVILSRMEPSTLNSTVSSAICLEVAESEVSNFACTSGPNASDAGQMTPTTKGSSLMTATMDPGCASVLGGTISVNSYFCTTLLIVFVRPPKNMKARKIAAKITA